MATESFYKAYGKRAFDLLVSGSVLCAASPLFVAVAAAVRVKLGSPVIFRQVRAGKGGEPFAIYKFRSMSDARGADGELLPDTERLTAFGKFLRKTSLDELPELWNIVRGDMSLVGPRPLLTKYVPLYNARQARRHEVRPGLTGWVAVNGRNTRSWEERFEQDVYYVENWGLKLDLYILWRTVAVVVSRENVDPLDAATMSEFKGTPATTTELKGSPTRT
jgi:lipopolysaccharide/colanic/teichoic acid biosynthesis glycosyltransferase